MSHRIPYTVNENEQLANCAFREFANPNKYLQGVFVTGEVNAVEEDINDPEEVLS